MNMIQKWKEYKLARDIEKLVEHKFDNAEMEISHLMDMQTYSTRMYNKMNLPKCINLVFIDSDSKTVIQYCKDFDKDLDCPGCKICRHYYSRQRYIEMEKEFKIARQQVKVARKKLIDEIKNIFALGR